MQDVITGRYRLSKTENFDAFLAEIGLGYIKRKLAQSTSPEINITRAGERWTMVTSSALSTSEVTFALDEEFPEDRQDGVSVTSCVSADGNVWTQTQKPGNGKDVTIVREFGETELRVMSTVNGVTANRVPSSPRHPQLSSQNPMKTEPGDTPMVTFSEQCPVTKNHHAFTFTRYRLFSARRLESFAASIWYSTTAEPGLPSWRSYSR
ncbi:cellular retinoic acid binding protein [Cordyceps fumosorosea ARSEF 2679]|uniref:Cellular retinoic acid binding protein n=1 Tax=Cordyceps fumosorosea (strain ARSEF 2679) TaxID=1081104 RepID=A0A168CDR1_CORFA|nr:cellular retinoic acid binding protein [Cordyceps fumosorosea ARSEF 2679]OAA71261.1 cellular retinoic acid binding protein [Cordyceps fumosorosea ARSEF 2679]